MDWPFVLLLCVGVLALILGALIAILRIRTIFFGARAEGTVVGLAESTSSTSNSSGSTRFVTLYSPIVEFQHDGKKHRFTSSMSTQAKTPKGAKVNVMFLPDQPDTTAEIGNTARLWGFPIAGLAVGTVFVVVALYGAGYLGGAPK